LQQSQLMMNGYESMIQTQEKCNILCQSTLGIITMILCIGWDRSPWAIKTNSISPTPIETEKRLTQISASTIYYSARTRTRESGITLTAHRQKRRKNKILFPLITR